MARQRARVRRPRPRVDEVVTLDEEYVEQMEAEKEESSETEPPASPEAEEKAVEPVEEQEVAHPDPDEGAQVFGKHGKAWMTVEIAEDHQQATLTALSFAGEKMKGQAVVDALKEIYHIQRGLKKKPLKEAIKKAKKEGEARGSFIIAKSKEPEPGTDGAIELLFQKKMEADAVLPYQAVKDALVSTDSHRILSVCGLQHAIVLNRYHTLIVHV